MTSPDDISPLETLAALDTEPEPSEYDQDLGRRVGRDAVRVSMGELSESAFHERWGDRLREEFGDDYRPPEPDAGVGADE